MAIQASWIYNRLYLAANSRLRHVAGGRFAHHCRPLSIILLLTELCNARCIHCDIWKNSYRESPPTTDQWKQFLTDIRRWLGTVQICFSGGEALMKPFTVDLVSHASQLGLFLEVLTHGYWEDQTKIERLALAGPWRVTVSLDGIGETHTRLRGRPQFWERSRRSIATLQRLRSERNLGYIIRLKHVIMAHNLDDTLEVARFAQKEGLEVFYQPIEQNYNTKEDPEWYLHTPNWPADPTKAVDNIRQLIAMKQQGFPIANSVRQLEVMIPYFENPSSLGILTKAHVANERQAACAALTMLQLQANGDVTICSGAKPVGNIKEQPIRTIWENRPQLWEKGCCLNERCSSEEIEKVVQIAAVKSAQSGR